MSIPLTNPPVVVVPIAFAEYDKPADGSGATQFDPLARIKNDVAAIQALFGSAPYRDCGFEVLAPIWGGTAGTITDALTAVRQQLRSRPGAVAILYWTGHGRTAGNELRLITRECVDPISPSDGLSPREVIGKLADAGLRELLVTTRR